MTSALPHRLGRLEQAHKARDPRKSLVLIGSASDEDPRTRQPLTKAAMGPATARCCWPPSTPHFCCAFRTKMRGLANMPGSSQTSPACSNAYSGIKHYRGGGSCCVPVGAVVAATSIKRLRPGLHHEYPAGAGRLVRSDAAVQPYATLIGRSASSGAGGRRWITKPMCGVVIGTETRSAVSSRSGSQR
jgi:hypothetical protein